MDDKCWPRMLRSNSWGLITDPLEYNLHGLIWDKDVFLFELLDEVPIVLNGRDIRFSHLISGP